MKFYRAKYDSGSWKIGAKLSVIAWRLRSMVKQNRQGSAVEYSGQISSSEAIQRGTHIVCDDQGIMTAYAVEPLTGMSGIRQYLLKEEGVI